MLWFPDSTVLGSDPLDRVECLRRYAWYVSFKVRLDLKALSYTGFKVGMEPQNTMRKFSILMEQESQ